MISTINKDKEEISFRNGQISKPVLRSFSRRILSLDRKKHDSQSKGQSLATQSVHKKDATTWKWFSSTYLSHTDLRLRKLATMIRSSKKIQELNIEFTECQRMSNRQLSYISQSLGAISGLKKLWFAFQECPKITDEGLFFLCKGLKRKCELESLSLGFTQSQITNKGVQALSAYLKGVRGLKELKLDFSECKEVSDVGLKVLSDGLKRVRELQSLSLSFSFCIKITNGGLQSLSEGFQKLNHSFKSLSLDFSNSGKITGEGVKSIGEALKKLVLLQKVDFKFKRCSRITGTSLQHICKGLENLILLKEISLDFSHQVGLGDLDMKIFSKVLKGLKALEILRIDFSDSGVTDEGLCFLSEARKSLKELGVNFSLCSNITDYGLQNLNLKEFVSLRALSIQFRQCYHMTDVGLESFSEGLRKLVLLRNVKIEFTSCSKITDKGFLSFCGALNKLVMLENLELDFSECPQITHQGGSKLCRVIKSFSSCLKAIHWNFDKCNLLGDTELYILCKNLKSCSQLERVKIRHGQDRNIMYYDDRQMLRWALDYTTQRLAEKGIVYNEKKEEDVEREKEEVVEEEKQQKEEGQKRERKNKSKAACGFNVFNRLFGCFTKKRKGGGKPAGIMVSNQV